MKQAVARTIVGVMAIVGLFLILGTVGHIDQQTEILEQQNVQP